MESAVNCVKPMKYEIFPCTFPFYCDHLLFISNSFPFFFLSIFEKRKEELLLALLIFIFFQFLYSSILVWVMWKNPKKCRVEIIEQCNVSEKLEASAVQCFKKEPTAKSFEGFFYFILNLFGELKDQEHYIA